MSLNDAYKVSPAKPQVHWHLRPRYDKSVQVGNEVFEDPNFGHHYLKRSEKNRVVSRELLKIIANKIRENL